MSIIQTGLSARESEYPVHDLIRGRWSPRAMSGERLSNTELFRLFEAAKWAPSAYNEQPWRILYVLRDTPEWKLFFDLFVEFNQSWIVNAGALILFLSRKTSSHNGAPLQTSSFDTGAAWQNLAIEGVSQDLVVHAMQGFDYERARKDLGIPDFMKVEAMVAVGKPAPIDKLPQALREKEKPSNRRPLSKTVAQGKWNEALA